LVNVRVKSKKEALEDPDVQRAVETAAEALGESGRILVRQSGTEPLIRVMVEAETDEICQRYAGCVTAALRANGHEV